MLRRPPALAMPALPTRNDWRTALRVGDNRLFACFATLLIGLAAIIAVTHLGQLGEAVRVPQFWLMTALAVGADARTFLTRDRRGKSAMVCPSLCFTFAILLCWDLGPAILAQLAAVIVVGWRLRYAVWRVALIGAQYVLAMSAAYAVLVVGQPDPFGQHGVFDAVSDLAAVLAAAGAWLAIQSLLVLASARLRWGRTWRRQTIRAIGYQFLFTAALLLISPVLAVSAHVTAAFVPLVFVPLYAVERMARLSAERDRVSRQDPLTGLANRSGLQAKFTEDHTALVARRGVFRSPDRRRLALFLLDLDRFKHVNDALGHDVGDQLLEAVAERLRSVVPPEGLAARLGGDEFAAVVPGLADSVEARAVAGRIADALAEPVNLDGLQVDVMGSLGVAVHPEDGEDFATLMRHADVAMYDAKQRGDAIAFYTPESDHNSPEQLALLTDFRRAVESGDREQLTLHYQPQVALDSGEVVGVEALLRWQHPTRGYISPEELLRVAEHTSVMQLITARVVDDAVRQVAQWSAQGLPLRVSVNVSIRDLHCDDIVTQLSSLLTRYGVRPELVQLEITEGALMADPGRVLATIARISALGVAVSLDDFGTGYSSLQHLRRLPLREVKVDRSFVAGMAHNSDDAAIVRSIVELARALGLRVVAEGVENRYTWRQLADAGCSVAQGWYSARPMPADRIVDWVTEHREKVSAASLGA